MGTNAPVPLTGRAANGALTGDAGNSLLRTGNQTSVSTTDWVAGPILRIIGLAQMCEDFLTLCVPLSCPSLANGTANRRYAAK